MLYADSENLDFKGPKSMFEIFRNSQKTGCSFFIFFQANFFVRYKCRKKSKSYVSKLKFNQDSISGVAIVKFSIFDPFKRRILNPYFYP